ncbi:MAG: DNA polymerase III subunit delta' [Bacteroidetes bacterium]|nr:DNA polymerase III subunit delta' [Bacteroidota bacterium]MDE2672901.1 DNA polymerase III subunit delta' [Bacteroidota bacterium]
MHWSNIIGQEKVIELLKNSVAAERVAHAYLFHGIDGVGKLATALAFARVLQCAGCHNGVSCQSCQWALKFQHPDIQVMMPQPSDADPEDVIERLALLSQDEYAVVDYIRAPSLNRKNAPKSLKQPFYSIERINLELRNKMIMRPQQGRYRIAIILDIHTINEQAANAFLKLLEEPGPDTVFIALTRRKDSLLPTILSRCQHIAFSSLATDVITQALQERKNIDVHLAATVANISNGSYSRAVELAENEDLRYDRERILDFLRLAFTQKIGPKMALIEEFNQAGRNRIKNLLELLLGWMRDVSLYRTIGENAPIVNQDKQVEIAKFCGNLDNADLDAMIRLIEEARLLTESNVNTTLLLINLSSNLGQAMRGPHSGVLFKSLTTLQPDLQA